MDTQATQAALGAIVEAYKHSYPHLDEQALTMLAAWALEIYKAPPPNRRAFAEALVARLRRDERLGSLPPDVFSALLQLVETLNRGEPDVERN